MLEGGKQPPDDFRQVELLPERKLSIRRGIVILGVVAHGYDDSVYEVNFLEGGKDDIDDAKRK